MSVHTSTNVDLMPVSHVNPALRRTLRDAGLLTTAAASTSAVPVDAFLAAGPFSHSLVPMQCRSNRGYDPYRACRVYMDRLLELQSQQMDLVESLRAAFFGPSMHTRLVSTVRDPPGAPQQRGVVKVAINKMGSALSSVGGSDSTSAHEERPLGTDDEVTFQPPSASFSSLVSLVDRLRVLQHESTEFAFIRCLPSLTELFGNFEAYWAWKRAQADDSGVQQMDGEKKAHTNLFPANIDPAQSPIDGATTAGGASPHQCGYHQRPSTLRQRYDEALHAREGFFDSLQQYIDTVRGLDAQLGQWCRSRDSDSATPSAGGWHIASATEADHTPVAAPHDVGTNARNQSSGLEAYISHLVEVTKTTFHMAQVLQAALRALCCPSSSSGVFALKLRATSLVKDQGLPRGSPALRKGEGNTDPDSRGVDPGRRPLLQVRSSVNSSEDMRSVITHAKHDGLHFSNKFDGASPKCSREPRPSVFSVQADCRSPSPHNPRNEASSDPLSTAQPSGTGMVRATTEDVQGSWMDVLSPLTPAPASAVSPASPSLSVPGCVEECGSQQQLRRQRHRRGSRSLSSPPTSDGAIYARDHASLISSSKSPQLRASPHAASVAPLSPLSGHRGASTPVAIFVPPQSSEKRAIKERHLSFGTPPLTSGEERLDEAEDYRDVQAAVTPSGTFCPTTNKSVTRDHDAGVSSHLATDADSSQASMKQLPGQDGVRSLLPELALASRSEDFVSGGCAALHQGCPAAVSRRSVTRERSTSAGSHHDMIEQRKGDTQCSTVVDIVPPSRLLSQHLGDGRSVSILPLSDGVRKSGRVCGTSPPSPSPSPSPPPQRVLATYTASASTVRGASLSLRQGTSPYSLSPRSFSMHSDACHTSICSTDGDPIGYGFSNAGRAATVPTSLWPQLYHRAASSSSLIATPVLNVNEVSESAKLADPTTAEMPTSDRAPSNAPEGGVVTTVIQAAPCTVDPGFYTAHGSGPGFSSPPSLASTLHASASSVPLEQSLRSPHQTQDHSQQLADLQSNVREWNCTFSPVPLTLDSVEKELGEVEHRLQVPAPTHHNSSTASEMSLAAGTRTALDTMCHSVEERVRVTLQKELKALRAEQRHSLHKMRKYIRHTFEEVSESLSAVGSCKHSSRGSSSASSRGQRYDTAQRTNNDNATDDMARSRKALVETEERRGAECASKDTQSPIPKRAVGASNVIPDTPTSNITAPSHAPSTNMRQSPQGTSVARVSPRVQVLQRSLALSEAKTARLEQLTVQLKKRLWMAELSRLSPTSVMTGPDAKTAAMRGGRIRLRDAFIYAPSSDTGAAKAGSELGRPNASQETRHEAHSESDAVAAATDSSVTAEERAMLYLVDRELGCRAASGTHSPAQHCPSPLLKEWLSSYDSPNDGHAIWHLSSSSARQECSSDMQCFEDDRTARVCPADSSAAPPAPVKELGAREMYLSAAPRVGATSTTTATGSLHIRQQRASIFDLLRREQSLWSEQPCAQRWRPRLRMQREGFSRLPLPSLLDPAQDTATTLPEDPTSSVPSALRGTRRSEHHPYNAGASSSEAGGERDAEAAAGHPRQAVVSDCGAAILNDGNFSAIGGLRSPASVSTLRVDNVLQNAKRLLQRRRECLGSGHHAIHDGWHRSPLLMSGSQSLFTAVSSPQTLPETKWDSAEMSHRLHEDGARVAPAALPGCPHQRGPWGNYIQHHGGASPVSQTCAAVAPDPGVRGTDVALKRNDQSVHRGAVGLRTGDSARLLHPYVQSPESTSRCFDSFPCSAMVQPDGKVPHVSLPGNVSHDSQREASARSVRCRVDSAALPLQPEDPEMRVATSSRERSVGSNNDLVVDHHERSRPRSASSADGDYSRSSSRSMGTGSTRSFPGSAIPHPAAALQVQEEREAVSVSRTSRLSPRLSHPTTSSTSSTASCNSAQQQFMMTLQEQESTLTSALNQLREQQRRLEEKRRQLSQLARKKPAGASQGAPQTRRCSGPRLTGTAKGGPRRRNDAAKTVGETSHTPADLDRLLKRFATAAASLEEREQRMLQALRVVQRQRSALSRDDLL